MSWLVGLLCRNEHFGCFHRVPLCLYIDVIDFGRVLMSKFIRMRNPELDWGIITSSNIKRISKSLIDFVLVVATTGIHIDEITLLATRVCNLVHFLCIVFSWESNCEEGCLDTSNWLDLLDDIQELRVLRLSTILTISHEHNVDFSHIWVFTYNLTDFLENRQEISTSSALKIIDFLNVFHVGIGRKTTLDCVVKSYCDQLFERLLFGFVILISKL